jgi:hypothetical protein
MSNVSGKAYAMTVLTPMPPRRTWLNVLLFHIARLTPSTLAGLKGLSLIHFARWVVIKRAAWPAREGPPLDNDYMLFCSNFNGTWDQYIDAFADGIPNGLDLFWYASKKYPHSIPISPFKAYIRANQIDNDYYYNATPGAAQRDVKAALRVRNAVLALAEQADSLSPDAFAAAYRDTLRAVQNDLSSQGYAPIASRDTERADERRVALTRRWADDSGSGEARRA